MSFTIDVSLEGATQKLAKLRAEHVYCAACGDRMVFKRNRVLRYDRMTGKEFNDVTHYSWICPKFDDWWNPGSENPHDIETIPTQKGDPLP